MCVCASRFEKLIQHLGDLTVIRFPPAAIVINKLRRERGEVSLWEMQMKAARCVVGTTGNQPGPSLFFLI